MAAYVIVQGEVLDPDGYGAYRDAGAASVLAAGGRYIVRGGETEALEGDAPPQRTVVLEFPTHQAALDWYRGDAYTAARVLREGKANLRFYVVDGV